MPLSCTQDQLQARVQLQAEVQQNQSRVQEIQVSDYCHSFYCGSFVAYNVQVYLCGDGGGGGEGDQGTPHQGTKPPEAQEI